MPPIRPAISWAARCCVEASSASARADSFSKLMQLCVCGDASKERNAKSEKCNLLKERNAHSESCKARCAIEGTTRREATGDATSGRAGQKQPRPAGSASEFSPFPLIQVFLCSYPLPARHCAARLRYHGKV